jgi:hypothetical protein
MLSPFLLPLLLATPLQDASVRAADARADPVGSWQPLNGVEAVINEEIITMSALGSKLRWQMATGNITTQDEYKRALQQIRDEEIIAHLKVQAGQDMGFAPEEVARLVAERRKRIKEGLGGTVNMREWLHKEGLDSITLTEVLSTSLIGGVWEDATTGKGAGVRGRLQTDRYIRPGQVYASYLECCADESLWHLVGGRAASYVLQTLDLPLDEVGGLTATMDMAGSLLDRARAGEDFGALADSYGQTSSPGGYQSARTAEELERSLGETVREFLIEGSVGDLSEILPVLRNDSVVGVRILRLAGILPSDPPKEFREPGVQRKLERLLQEGLDARHIVDELQMLARAAYVWPSAAAVLARAEASLTP